MKVLEQFSRALSFARAREQPKAQELTKEHGKTAVGSVLSPWRDSVADTLTPQKLASIMKAADKGDVEAFLTLCEEMEERETHYASVLGTRKLGVSGSPVVVDAPDDSSGMKALTEDVEQTIVKNPAFEGLVQDLMDGVAKGFSCVEIMWSRDVKRWQPTAYEFRPQRHFVFDMNTLNTPRLRSELNPIEGVELAPFKWIVHKPKIRSGIPIRAGLARTVAVAYAAKRYTVADWLVFLDLFGIPIRLGKYPFNMADKKSALLSAIRQIGTDAAAVIPKEMEVEILQAGKTSGNGGTLFLQSAEYWDKQTSKVVLGQTMTTDDGSSLAQAVIHQRTQIDIRKADARSVANTINRDLVIPFIVLNYGEQKSYPTVRIQAEEPEDTKSLMESTKVFVSLGGEVQMSEIRDRLGFSEPEEGAKILLPESVIAANATSATQKPTDKNKPPTLGEDRQANRARFSRQRDVEDVVDETSALYLDDWQSLENENVGRLIKRAQEAKSFQEMRDALDELAKDGGEELAIGLVTANLARAMFQLRGVGAATDKTDL
jgi:phage gp29-like protein